jgi:predicted PurR-regulated permease PerM
MGTFDMHTVLEAAGHSTSARRVSTWVIFAAAAAFVGWLCVAILRPFASVIAWASILAILCYPLHERLVRRTRRVALSAFITSVVTVLACVVPLLAAGGIAAHELMTISQSWPDAPLSASEPLAQATAVVSRIARRVGLSDVSMREWIESQLGQVARRGGQFAISIATSLFDVIVSSALVIFAMFLLLRDGRGIVGTIADAMPFERSRNAALLVRIKDVVHASIYGVVVIAVVQGTLCGIMFAVLGIPGAPLWGLLTVFVSVLPVVGAFGVWGPGTLYLAQTGAWGEAAVLAVWGTFVVSGVDNVLRPRLVAGRSGLSELAMFFALLGGLRVFGPVGIVLGPVVFATAAAIAEALRDSHIAADADTR